MSTTLAPPPPRTSGDAGPRASAVPSGLLGAVELVESALDQLLTALEAPDSSTALDSALCAQVLERVDRLGRRCTSARWKVLATAERTHVAERAGFTGTSAWSAIHTQTARAQSTRETDLATRVDISGPCAQTGEALSRGRISAGHAAVITRAVDDLPAEVSTTDRARVEAHLIDRATRVDPDRLRRIARRSLEAIEPDPARVDAHEDALVQTEERAAEAAATLTLHDNGDGTTTGRFTLPTLAAGILRTVLDAMTAPRRSAGSGAEAGVGAPGPWRSPEAWKQARGLAFTTLIEHLPTDHLTSKTAATVLVTLDHDTLTGALKAAGLSTGERLSGGAARRLACSAGILPAVLSGTSSAVDLGRQQRLFTDTQRTALAARHTECAAAGCDRPYAWCELHHRQPWAAGGATDLGNAVPLCRFHHQRIHDTGYLHAQLPDGTLRFTRRT